MKNEKDGRGVEAMLKKKMQRDEKKGTVKSSAKVRKQGNVLIYV